MVSYNVNPHNDPHRTSRGTHWRLYHDHREGPKIVKIINPLDYELLADDRIMTTEAFPTREAALAALEPARVLPYHEDRAHLDLRLLDRHVPIIANFWPRWYYITAVVVSPPDSFMLDFVSPTHEELLMVASFHDEYVERYYGRTGWMINQRKKHAFDIDGGAAGRYLAKYEHGGWAIKISTWRHEQRPFKSDPPKTLIEVLDKHHTICGEPMDHWVKWKADRPEVFGKVKSHG